MSLLYCLDRFQFFDVEPARLLRIALAVEEDTNRPLGAHDVYALTKA